MKSELDKFWAMMSRTTLPQLGFTDHIFSDLFFPSNALTKKLEIHKNLPHNRYRKVKVIHGWSILLKIMTQLYVKK